MTKFSIVIPLYNKEKDVFDTIQSVKKQTHANFEIIIVDDGSTDKSLEIVKNIIDKRIHIFSKNNEGVSTARNYGVKKASSNYIAFLDADDYWYPNHLAEIHSMIIQFPHASWYATSYEKTRNTNLTTPMVSPLKSKGENWIGEIDDFFKNSLIDCLAWTSSVCVKKDFYTTLDGFDKDISHGEDTDFWIRAALSSNLIFSNKITSTHNLDSYNRSSDIPSGKRKNLNLSKFETEEKKNTSLKKYLDLNRYSLAIQYKMSGDKVSFKKYSTKINLDNLNARQQFLFNQPSFSLNLMIRIQKLLERLGIRVSSF